MDIIFLERIPAVKKVLLYCVSVKFHDVFVPSSSRKHYVITMFDNRVYRVKLVAKIK